MGPSKQKDSDKNENRIHFTFHSKVSSILKTADIYITNSMKILIKIATNIVCSTAEQVEDLQLTTTYTSDILWNHMMVTTTTKGV